MITPTSVIKNKYKQQKLVFRILIPFVLRIYRNKKFFFPFFCKIKRNRNGAMLYFYFLNKGKNLHFLDGKF